MQRQVQTARWLAVALAGGIILLAVILAYQPVWSAFDNRLLVPWGSDTLGHLYRYEFVKANIQEGHWYPQIMPQWYMGMQLLRYYPPLPYYMIFALEQLLGSPFAAIHGFILLWTVVGGLSCLLFRRWVGLAAAGFCGVAYTVLPDLVRVAFSEGNLPRVMAAALAPTIFYLAITHLEGNGNRLHRLALSLLFAAVTLTHAMMAAIFGVALFLLLVIAVLTRRGAVGASLEVLILIALGILLAGAWLLPSLTGGITELESGAVNRGLEPLPWGQFLNPLQRTENIETPYVGLALIVTVLLSIALPWVRNRWVVVAGVSGLILSILATPQLNHLFTALPLSSLLWPVRFHGIASLFLLFAFVASLQKWWAKTPILAVLLAGLVLIDSGVSLRLIFLRPLDPSLAAIGQEMAESPGWREATLDESRLGSAPSWIFSNRSQREQVFGWGYQGARTAHNVASLNDALVTGSTGYLLDRLALYGVDDVVALDALINNTSFRAEAVAQGFKQVTSDNGVTYFHRDGYPRAVVAGWNTLGIGRSALNYAFLFPQVITGDSPYIDEYTVEELSQYQKVILSGFAWHDREKAESLVRQLAEKGVVVFVDLTLTQSDPVSQLPRFLDVWGETVILPPEPIQASGWTRPVKLAAFGSATELWHTHVLQNLQNEVVTFDFLGKDAVLAGYNPYGKGKVWFIGANLVYHALTEEDGEAVTFLAELLELAPGTANRVESVRLQDYRAGSQGYSFSYHLEDPQTLLVPVARLDGTLLQIDGKTIEIRSLENLVLFDAPAGSHRVTITYRPPPIFFAGAILSGLSAAGLAWLMLINKHRKRQP